MISFLSLNGTEFCHFLNSIFNQYKPINGWDISLLELDLVGLGGGGCRTARRQEMKCRICSQADWCAAIWGWEDVVSILGLSLIIYEYKVGVVALI